MGLEVEGSDEIVGVAPRRLPMGNLTLIYDELGNKYEIPPYCLSDPSNLINEVRRPPARPRPAHPTRRLLEPGHAFPSQ